MPDHPHIVVTALASRFPSGYRRPRPQHCDSSDREQCRRGVIPAPGASPYPPPYLLAAATPAQLRLSDVCKVKRERRLSTSLYIDNPSYELESSF